MNKIFAKTVLACSVAVGLLAASAANAGTFNPFTVVPPDGKTPFVADKITGNYTEVVTFNANNTFDVSLYWVAGQFVTDGGNTPLKSSATGLNGDYGVYALYKASGDVTTSGSATTFTFKPGTGSLSLFLDVKNDTDNPNGSTGMTGTSNFALTGTSDDLLMGSGNPLSGSGTLDPTKCASGGINCGSFGQQTSLALTAIGKGFFTVPSPFYDLTFESGQLNNFSPTATQTINGSLDVVFDTAAIPEPATAALFGLGLAGLVLSRRRQQS